MRHQPMAVCLAVGIITGDLTSGILGVINTSAAEVSGQGASITGVRAALAHGQP